VDHDSDSGRNISSRKGGSVLEGKTCNRQEEWKCSFAWNGKDSINWNQTYCRTCRSSC